MDYLARPFLLLCLATTAFAAAPVMDNPATSPPNFPRSIPVGKTLIFPLTAEPDFEGHALEYKVTSSNPRVIARVKTGNPLLRLAVSYDGGQTGEMQFILFRDWAPKTTDFMHTRGPDAR